ncbi:MAG: hypothetical protein HYU64_01810 [Armatimonadetes bacterium]|nr:hypothetical protein [Armatimonadota bacterium]
MEDFVGTASETSTRVHVGEKEAFRLLGEQPETGPLVSFLRLYVASECKDLFSIHIRDWHPRDDPEFERYGEHCVAGSEGARFVWDRWLSIPENGRHFPIHSRRLNLFAEGILPGLLRFLLHREDPLSVRFGVIGVTTNIKIFNICEGLMDYLEARQVAVCSELTASTSVRNHFKGLDDLESRLGVKVLERVAEFRK